MIDKTVHKRVIMIEIILQVVNIKFVLIHKL